MIGTKKGFRKFSSDDPAMLLILGDCGIRLASRRFLAEILEEEDLIGLFLTGVGTVGKVLLPGSDLELEEIHLNGLTLIRRRVVPIVFYYVFSGSSSAALRRLSSFIQELQKNDILWNAFHRTLRTGEILSSAIQETIDSIMDRFFLQPAS